MLEQDIKNSNLCHGLKLWFGWYGGFNAATLAQQFVAVFLYLVVQTPRCGGSWGLFHNTGLLSQPALKISMKWTSQLEFIMKDQSVWLQDIHENQYPNLIWQIIQNINSYGTNSSEVLNFHRFTFVGCVNGHAEDSGSSVVGSKSDATHWPFT